VVLNATGPWADRVRALAGEAEQDLAPLLAPTKGVHLIAADQGLQAALVLLHPRDGRVFFVLPWLGKTLIGTTDTDCAKPGDELTGTEADRDYLLEGYNHHFAAGLAPADLLGQFAALRPLLRSVPGEPSARSREFRVVTGSTGLITVAGGKYTTYRQMAEVITNEVVRRLGGARRCRTRDFGLLGTPSGSFDDFATGLVSSLCRHYPLTDSAASGLLHRYGRRAEAVARYTLQEPRFGQAVIEGEPDLLAELAYQRDHEMAVRPEDFLLRRTRLGLFHPELLRQPPALVKDLSA
jgi:glycerol-3-phosphate dehydrogenase